MRSILSLPDDQLDYPKAKLAFDQVIDRSIKPAEITAELDKMARTASAMAGSGASQGRKLTAQLRGLET